MSRALDGMTVVVTRPAAQSGRFIELARASGATCIAYPTLQVEPLALAPQTLARLRGRTWDWAIFTSVNAVAACLANLAPPLAVSHAAVGRATARALEQAGVTVAARPDSATSEGVLALPEFADVTGRGVLLVKGSGGRELLTASLRARGADVLELEVYRRCAVPPDTAAATALHAALAQQADGPAVVVTVTSTEILRSLLAHVASAEDAVNLRRCALIVPGARVAAEAVLQGWTGPVVQSSTAEDETMVQALSQLAGGSLPAA
ncbi:MAG: uroporphyrinogen-III synthase [Steroidobacteraceae bacterium]